MRKRERGAPPRGLYLALAALGLIVVSAVVAPAIYRHKKQAQRFLCFNTRSALDEDLKRARVCSVDADCQPMPCPPPFECTVHVNQANVRANLASDIAEYLRTCNDVPWYHGCGGPGKSSCVEGSCRAPALKCPLHHPERGCP